MKRLEGILRELHPDVDFASETELASNGVLDSFDVVTLVGEIEDHYGVVIPPEELVPENFESLETIGGMIRRMGGICSR